MSQLQKVIAIAGTVGLLFATSAGAAVGKGGNIGTVHGVAGGIPNGLVSSMFGEEMVGYTCGSVHEKRAIGLVAVTGLLGPGVEDKQTCKLDAGAVLPKKPTTYTPGNCANPSVFKNADDAYFGWYSDYKFTVSGELVLADTLKYTVMPSGTVVITSFYADAAPGATSCPAELWEPIGVS